jgi:hypothetical protein
MYTFNDVADILQNQWENDIPDQVLNALRPMNGKNITTRILDRLPGGKDVWRLTRNYGMTHIENRDYWHSSGNSREGVNLLVDWRTDSFPLDIAALEKNNAAYFSARKERNHSRMEARNNRELLTSMADAMNKIEAANKALEAAKNEFEALTEYGSAFYADKFELERTCGLRPAKVQQ